MTERQQLGAKSRLDSIQAENEVERLKIEKKLELLSSATNELFNSETGAFFLKEIIRLCGVMETKSYLGGDMLHFREGMKYVYVNAFKKFLNAEMLAKLEKEVLNDRS